MPEIPTEWIEDAARALYAARPLARYPDARKLEWEELSGARQPFLDNSRAVLTAILPLIYREVDEVLEPIADMASLYDAPPNDLPDKATLGVVVTPNREHRLTLGELRDARAFRDQIEPWVREADDA